MILVINGSPRKDSKTMSITKKIIETTSQEITILNPYNLNIKSCDDCRYCSHTKGCIKKDDMDNLYQLLQECTTLIISSPVYFGAFTDQTMKLINRFQRYFGEKWIIKSDKTPVIKNLIAVSSAASINPKMFHGPSVTIDILSKLFSVEYSFTVFVSDSDNTPLLNEETLAKINKLKKVI